MRFLFITVYLANLRFAVERRERGSLPTCRAARSQVAGWLAAARTPKKKKKSSSRLLRKKRGTVGPRERWITKVDFPLRREEGISSSPIPSDPIPLPLRRLHHVRRPPPSLSSSFLSHPFPPALRLEDLEWDDYRRENLEGELRYRSSSTDSI